MHVNKNNRAREIPHFKPRWLFASVKRRCLVHCESCNERNFCYFLEFDRLVKTYQEQPLKIPYFFEGNDHNYYPDFQTWLIYGHRQIIEVKPSQFIDTEENLRKFRVGQDYAIDNDMDFIVVTDEMLNSGFTLNNMKRIYRHAFSVFPNDMFLRTTDALANINDISVDGAIKSLNPVIGEYDPRSVFLRLIWDGKIVVDISKAILPATIVKVNHC
jgi:hypothetical protein